MERVITQRENSINAMNTASFEMAAVQFEKESEKVEELSCNQLIKNLLKTNLKLLKLNEISAVLLF